MINFQNMDSEEMSVYRRVSKSLKKQKRFDNYREITAKFNSTGACGHEIKKGDRVGWNRYHGCECKNCWSRWVAENREADLIEQGFMNTCL